MPEDTPPVTTEQAQSLLHSFAKLADKYPEKPGMLLELAKTQSPEALKASLLLAMPEPWHNAVGTFLDTQDEDQLKLLACLCAVVFVQGLNAGRIIQQKQS